MAKTMRFKLHRQVMCPNCKAQMGYGTDIINKKDIKCPKCQTIFSYDDGFIEFLATKPIDSLFLFPIYSGVEEIGPFKIRVGKATEVRFKTSFYEIYNIKFGRPVETDEKLFEQITLASVDISKDGFIVISSSFNDSIINQEIEIAYIASGRDFFEDVPIWHRFLQGSINSIGSQRYGMAIVESISAFDAFFDEFLMDQLMEKRGYSVECVRQIATRYNRRDKLFYFLFYVTRKSFEDSPYNEDLKHFADLRNKIVHPKKYEFKESDLTKEEAMKALETVIKGIKWVNDTKNY